MLYLVYQLIFNQYAVNNLVDVTASINGESYRVHAAHKNKKQAAETLATIDQALMNLIRELKRSYPNHIITRRIMANYNPDKIAENTPFNMFNYTSYTINKGEMIRYCIRNKDTDASIEDYGHLIFVAIHELGHVGAEGYGHDDDFWRTFKFLLNAAAKIGIYDPVDYASNNFTYCGMKVTYNPYFDPTL